MARFGLSIFGREDGISLHPEEWADMTRLQAQPNYVHTEPRTESTPGLSALLYVSNGTNMIYGSGNMTSWSKVRDKCAAMVLTLAAPLQLPAAIIDYRIAPALPSANVRAVTVRCCNLLARLAKRSAGLHEHRSAGKLTLLPRY